ncbi:FkbM family methyltransferase [Halorubrum yunnanense]|uniref:FkbM family methyltransferase n=1 Tax=Halorubrum yunnanense TaxID=1526162 RepID=A0ABD5YGD2_9EURY|nr:FkbM family methyltransferase [Halorubrum yunnanense]
MKSIIRRIGKAINGFSGGLLSETKTVRRVYNQYLSGTYEFENFSMYVPPEGIGMWEDQTKGFIRDTSEGSVFWDIGANIGFLSLYAADGAKLVRAFEPEPNNYRILNDNIESNSFDNIRTHNVAVSQKEGEAILYQGSEGGGTHSLARSENLKEGSVSVKSTTTDSLVAEYGAPDFVKVDVEGAEFKVLKGASDSLENHRITWLIEVHSSQTGKRGDRLSEHGATVHDLYGILTEYGYDVYGFDGDLFEFDLEDDALPLHWYATKDNN